MNPARAAALLALAGLVTGAAAQQVTQQTAAIDPWLAPALVYDGDVFVNLRGGARRGSSYVGNLHLKLTAKGDTIGLPGTSAFVDVLTIHGGRPSRFVGDAQGVSNIEGPPGTQVEELWLQHNFKGSSASLLAGIYDLNSEFYRLTAAGLFLNSAFGIGPEFAQSGVEGPSIFPRTAAGLRFAFKPTPDTVLRAALLDGVPVVRPDGSRAAFRAGDGLLGVAEFAWLSRPGATPAEPGGTRDRIGRFSSLMPYEDKLALGLWRYSGRYPDLSETDVAGNPTLRRGTSGAYVVGERLLAGDGDGASGRRLAAFAQAGFADARTNRFAAHFGAGLVGSGWGPMQASDQFGVSITHARNGAHYQRAQAAATDRAETTIELSYLTQLAKYLSLQPDLQYVRHPNTDPTLASAWVFQLRFELAF
ncbi:MAG: carbohydrate porin [Burkholderiales bacterium]